MRESQPQPQPPPQPQLRPGSAVQPARAARSAGRAFPAPGGPVRRTARTAPIAHMAGRFGWLVDDLDDVATQPDNPVSL